MLGYASHSIVFSAECARTCVQIVEWQSLVIYHVKEVFQYIDYIVSLEMTKHPRPCRCQRIGARRVIHENFPNIYYLLPSR